MTYDTANRRTSLEVDTWMNATWENHIRKLYTYNIAGQCTELLYQNTPGFMDTTWENFEKYTYAYNTAGTHLSTTVRVWDFVEGDWRLDMRYLYTYSGNRLDSIVSQYYHTPWALWINKQKKHVEYNADNLITSLWDENWMPWNDPNGSWTLQGGCDRYVFFYEDYQDNGVNTLSIQGGNNTLPFQVYPNPAASQLAISIPGKLIDKVSVTDMLGREVFSSKTMNRATTLGIPVGHLPEGNYVVEVWSDKNKGSRLVAIKH